MLKWDLPEAVLLVQMNECFLKKKKQFQKRQNVQFQFKELFSYTAVSQRTGRFV